MRLKTTLLALAALAFAAPAFAQTPICESRGVHHAGLPPSSRAAGRDEQAECTGSAAAGVGAGGGTLASSSHTEPSSAAARCPAV